MIASGFLVGSVPGGPGAGVELFPQIRSGFFHFIRHARLIVPLAKRSLIRAFEQLFPSPATVDVDVVVFSIVWIFDVDSFESVIFLLRHILRRRRGRRG